MSNRIILLFLAWISPVALLNLAATTLVSEVVYVESPTDTDSDGVNDKIYVKITRPLTSEKLPAILEVSPYALGGNNPPFHNVDVGRLPQDDDTLKFSNSFSKSTSSFLVDKLAANSQENILLNATQRGYASISAHSLGTGNSTGCPTVGDEAETLATKSVIDWLNGNARAFDKNGEEIRASWANGNTGMIGVSYNGTLPNMVATTGVEGLKAIIPVAAISSWYDYYRANGLVVGPGGYVGEDADILGRYVVRREACSDEMIQLGLDMGREHGDFHEFWQQRDYTAKADGVKAAVFIMHGQSDWNVRQTHAIKWWQALEGKVPLKMWLHNGGHNYPSRFDRTEQTWAWFDRYVKGEENDIESSPRIEVQDQKSKWRTQDAWPHEGTNNERFYLSSTFKLTQDAGAESNLTFEDNGKSIRFERLLSRLTETSKNRLAFIGAPLSDPILLSGTTKVSLNLSIQNRSAANITVAIVEYTKNRGSKVITRGWADPQNYRDAREGEPLSYGEKVQLTFDLEPKQHVFSKGNSIGVVVASTDYDHTLRPEAGTLIELSSGEKSFVELSLMGMD